MTIIRTQSAIAAASTADLIETYNALTGKSIKKFSSRAAGESQVANAILAAEDRAAHLGVAKGAKPVAITEREAAQKTPTGAQEAPASVPSPKPLRAKLAEKAGAASPNKPRPKAERAPSAGRRPKVEAVVPTGRGEFRLQAASIRGNVMRFIEAEHAKTGAPVTVESVVKAHGPAGRGAVIVLIGRDHLQAV